MWKYVQTTGEMFQNGNLVDRGYSGTGAGRDNPSMECEINVGPIPRGYYNINPAVDHPRTGPVTMPLTPSDPNYCKPPRTGFMIHGDNSTGNASTGCIILKRSTRERIRDSGDKSLQVVATTRLSSRRKHPKKKRKAK